MKILSLTPGTGGTFYCQNCLRDGLMVRALRQRGHDVIVLPLYLPILLDAEGLASTDKVFFGGVNAYLQQHVPLFRHTPRWLDKLLDAAWVLRAAAKREGSTRAADLGPMTYSMLQGRDGRQRKEVERLLEWLRTEPAPDVVHISNALLLGVASEIKREFGGTVVCSLQDEDTFIDAMTPAWRDRCWALMAEKAQEVDLSVAVSDWYADKMAARLRLPRERVRTVYLGTEWDGLPPAPLDFSPPTLGYLSRISHGQGFTRLVDAFIALKRDPQLKDLRLRVTGGATSGGEAYLREMQDKLRAVGILDDVEILEDFTKPARQEFMRSLDVLSAPAPDGEAFGLFIIEAGACGVPVVQPSVGAFREVIEKTGGGVVYDPADAGALERELRSLLLDPERARALGQSGRAGVHAHFNSAQMAERMADVFAEAAGVPA